jgi:phage tail-like protein
MAEERKNPYAAFNFIVKGPDGKDLAGFMEVSGLDGENAVIEYREGSDQSGQKGAFVRKQPGIERYPNVVLRRGITGSTTLWDMRKKIRDADEGPELAKKSDTKTADFFIELQNEVHKTVFKWKLQNGWISKLSGPSLNAKSNEIAVESVEIVCERIEVDTST